MSELSIFDFIGGMSAKSFLEALEGYLSARANRPSIYFERCAMETEKESQVRTALERLEKVSASLAEAVERLEIRLSPILRPKEEKPGTVEETEKAVALASRIHETVWHLEGVLGILLDCANRLEL